VTEYGRLLSAVSFGTVTINVGVFLISPLVPAIAAEFGLGPMAVGLTLGALWAAFGLAQYPGGHVADCLSRKTVLVTSLGVFTAGTLLVASAPAYPVFLLGVATLGLGAGLYPTAAFVQLSETFVHRRRQVLALNTASINVGGILAGAVAAGALAVADWRVALVPVLGAGVLAVAFMNAWNGNRYDLSGVDLGVRETGSRLRRSRRLVGVIAVYSLAQFAWQGVITYLPTFLSVVKGFPGDVAGYAFAGTFAVGALVTALVGRLGDAAGDRTVATGFATLAVVGLTVATVASAPAVVLGGVFAFGAGMMAFWPPMNAHVLASIRADRRGSDFGAIRTVFFAVGSLAPVYVGTVAEFGSYAVAFGGLALCVVAAVAGTLRIVEA
jgi:MFS family permease